MKGKIAYGILLKKTLSRILHIHRQPFLNKPHLLSTIRLLILAFIISVPAGWSVRKPSEPRDGWQPLQWLDRRSDGATEADDVLKSKMEQLLEVFKRAGTLNPPSGVAIFPRGDLLTRSLLPGGYEVPSTANLRLSMRFPYVTSDVTARVSVRINDPGSLLGDPVLADERGGIYILPPLIERKGGQQVYSRSAHPVEYDEKFPSYSSFPLWDSDAEPFLRSVVRPTFALSQSTVATIFTSGGHPFWEPVSQERWILALKERASDELRSFRSGVDAARETDYTTQQIENIRGEFRRLQNMLDEEAIIERHENLLKQAEEMFEMMRAFNPEEAEKNYKKMLEDAGEQLEAQLKMAEKNRPKFKEYEQKLLQALLTMDEIWDQADAFISQGDWDGLDQLGEELEVPHFFFLADAGRKFELLKAELNAMPASERMAPAYGFELPPWHTLGPYKHIVAMEFDAERASGLVDPDAEGARALVAINPQFFASFTDPSSVRLLAVEWWEMTDARYRSEGGMFYNERRVNMLDDLWNSLDWNSISAIVD